MAMPRTSSSNPSQLARVPAGAAPRASAPQAMTIAMTMMVEWKLLRASRNPRPAAGQREPMRAAERRAKRHDEQQRERVVPADRAVLEEREVAEGEEPFEGRGPGREGRASHGRRHDQHVQELHRPRIARQRLSEYTRCPAAAGPCSGVLAQLQSERLWRAASQYSSSSRHISWCAIFTSDSARKRRLPGVQRGLQVRRGLRHARRRHRHFVAQRVTRQRQRASRPASARRCRRACWRAQRRARSVDERPSSPRHGRCSGC